jgi:hypothetical protein
MALNPTEVAHHLEPGQFKGNAANLHDRPRRLHRAQDHSRQAQTSVWTARDVAHVQSTRVLDVFARGRRAA